MAWVKVKSSNVTKYDAGGSGDNIISDGYIKAVEKVWIDSHTMAQTDTKTTIVLAKLPDNKKITSVDITIETTVSQTSHTLALGFDSDSAIDTLVAATNIAHNATASTLRLPGGIVGGGAVATTVFEIGDKGFQWVTAGTQTSLALLLNNWTSSSGTIKSVVRYT